jgi:hypothetical protein
VLTRFKKKHGNNSGIKHLLIAVMLDACITVTRWEDTLDHAQQPKNWWRHFQIGVVENLSIEEAS